MYSYEDRMRAVELYIQFDLQAEKTARALGYASARNIQRWYKEYKENGALHKKITGEKRYSEQQKEVALNYYLEHGQNIAKTVRACYSPWVALCGSVRFWGLHGIVLISLRRVLWTAPLMLPLTRS